MKKKIFSSAIISILALSFSGCGTGGQPRISSSIPAPSPSYSFEIIGLTPVDDVYISVVNNSGMSGSPAGNIHYHNNRPADMFAGEKQDLIFDMGRIEQLGKLNIWNHNAGDGSNGLRDITVSFSEDNLTYTELGGFNLRQGGGTDRLPVSNLTDGSIIDFNGVSARYMKINPETNYGGEQWGLSEIRLFRYRHQVYRGSYIAAIPVFDMRQRPPPASSSNVTSGAGLSNPAGADALHTNNPAHMYAVSGRIGTFDIDIMGRYPLEKIVIWNYNDTANINWGLESVTVRLSDDLENWTSVVTNTAIPAGTGQNGMGPSLTIPMNNSSARFIRITGTNRGGTQTGLSAIRCYAGEGWYADNVSDWTALLSVYPPDNSGWAGADGFYSVSLDGRDYNPARRPEDRRTFFHFSDTILSRVNPVTASRMGFGMPNNTRAIQIGTPHHLGITFNTNVIIPDPPVPHQFYWLGANFVIGDKLYIYTVKIDNSAGGAWGFRQVGVDLVRLEIKDGTVDESSLVIIKDTNNNLFNTAGSDAWAMNSAVLLNTAAAGAINPDGYLYVYGVAEDNGRNLVVTRVREVEIEDFSKYEYLWNDHSWRNQVWRNHKTDAKYLNPSTERDFSPEFSIHEVKWGPDRGKFWHVYMDSRYFDRWIWIRIADSPAGDYRNSRQIYHANEPFLSIPHAGQIENDNPLGMYTYNAKAHPALSPEGELYISYNVNGGIARFADIYRPRIIRYAQVPLTAEN
ncbi:MAG: hypothetical protein FWG89_04670 [Treponema sp.]|nr:hypothetical protein [Treponema sp.]